jgi:hypothetical protein
MPQYINTKKQSIKPERKVSVHVVSPKDKTPGSRAQNFLREGTLLNRADGRRL